MNTVITNQSDCRHAKDLSSGSEEDRQHHSLSRRTEDVAVHQLPAELLLGVFAGINLQKSFHLKIKAKIKL